MATKLGKGGKGEENFDEENGRYSTEVQKAIKAALARPDSDLRLSKYKGKMSSREIQSHKLDQFVYSPFFVKNGFATLNNMLSKKDKYGGIYDIYDIFKNPNIAESYDLAGVDYAIRFGDEFYAVDLKTFIPNKKGKNEVLKLPLIVFDSKQGKYVDGWFTKKDEIMIKVDGVRTPYKNVLTEFWVFQNISKDLTNINTSLVKKDTFKNYIFDNYFDGNFDYQLYFNQFKSVINNKQSLQNKPEKLKEFRLTYNKNDNVCQVYKTIVGKNKIPINIVCNIYYKDDGTQEYSFQLQPPVKILDYIEECQSLNGNEQEEDIVIEKLFNYK